MEGHCGHTQDIMPLPCPRKNYRLLERCLGPSTNFVTLELSPSQSPLQLTAHPPEPQLILVLLTLREPAFVSALGRCLGPTYRACCLEAQGLAAVWGLEQRSCKSGSQDFSVFTLPPSRVVPPLSWQSPYSGHSAPSHPVGRPGKVIPSPFQVRTPHLSSGWHHPSPLLSLLRDVLSSIMAPTSKASPNFTLIS